MVCVLLENLVNFILILLNGVSSKINGRFAGTPHVKLKADHDGQKGKGCTLKNHTAKQHLAHVNHLPILKHDGLFCLYNMLELVIKHYMPPKHLLEDIGYIFWKEASIGQIAVSFIVGNVL